MKYKFTIMTNYPDALKEEIDRFNQKNGTDLKFLRELDDEVLFVELETSITDAQLFEFGVQFGMIDAQKRFVQWS